MSTDIKHAYTQLKVFLVASPLLLWSGFPAEETRVAQVRGHPRITERCGYLAVPIERDVGKCPKNVSLRMYCTDLPSESVTADY